MATHVPSPSNPLYHRNSLIFLIHDVMVGVGHVVQRLSSVITESIKSFYPHATELRECVACGSCTGGMRGHQSEITSQVPGSAAGGQW